MVSKEAGNGIEPMSFLSGAGQIFSSVLIGSVLKKNEE
jgi:hypothetical protein